MDTEGGQGIKCKNQRTYPLIEKEIRLCSAWSVVVLMQLGSSWTKANEGTGKS